MLKNPACSTNLAILDPILIDSHQIRSNSLVVWIFNHQGENYYIHQSTLRYIILGHWWNPWTDSKLIQSSDLNTEYSCQMIYLTIRLKIVCWLDQSTFKCISGDFVESNFWRRRFSRFKYKWYLFFTTDINLVWNLGGSICMQVRRVCSRFYQKKEASAAVPWVGSRCYSSQVDGKQRTDCSQLTWYFGSEAKTHYSSLAYYEPMHGWHPL